MQITDVKVRKVESTTRMLAFASVTFDNDFVVHDMKVIQGGNGIFVAMPSRKDQNGNFIDIAHPINSNMREQIQNAVLEAYNNLEE